MPEEEAAPQLESFSALQQFVSEFETLGTPLLFIGLTAGVLIGYAIAKVRYDQKKK